MHKIKIVTKGGLIPKKDPVVIPEIYFGSFSNDISTLLTYEDLCRYKKKQQLATDLWNIGYCFCVAKTKGAFYNNTIAFIAYDEYEDFPVWIIICAKDDFNNQIHYKYYDATSQNRKSEFSWALPAIQTDTQFNKLSNWLSDKAATLYLYYNNKHSRKDNSAIWIRIFVKLVS